MATARAPKLSTQDRLKQLLLNKVITKVEFNEDSAGQLILTTADSRVSVSADGDDSARITVRVGTWIEEEL